MSGSLSDEIAKLRSAINQSKSQPQQKDLTNNAPYNAYSAPRGGSFNGGFRGRGRGWARGRGTFPIRNRTLVVNNQNNDSEFVSTVSSNGRKLINKSIYDKELQEKNLSKEEKVAKLQDAKYKILIKKLEVRASKNRVKLDLCDRCLIDGDIYAISKYGARLVPTDIPTGIKPMKVQWNGYDYTRTKNGSLKLSAPKVFLKEQCRYYQKTGVCTRENTCRYTHNASKIALCKKYIKGRCQGECKLSHEPNEYNVPLCHFYVNGSCKNPQCLFLHSHPDLELICRPFAIGGYCFRGKACNFRHCHECPDYQLYRECPRGKHCKLTHSNEDNLDAKLLFNTLDPENFQLPNLTKLDNLHQDPRAQIRSDIEQNPYNLYDSDSEEEDEENISDSISTASDALEKNDDYITF